MRTTTICALTALLTACGGPTGDDDAGPPATDDAGPVTDDAGGEGFDAGGIDPRCLPPREAVDAHADEYGAQRGGFGQVLDGELVCFETWGDATADDVFGWGRLTAFLTALVALEMDASGELDLDATVESIVGPIGYEPAAWASAITVRHLVWRDAGIGRPEADAIAGCTEDGPSIDEFLAAQDDGDRVLHAAPGAIHDNKSRVQVILLGQVIATAGGDGSFAQTVHRVLFDRVGMTDSWMGWGPEVADRVAPRHGYQNGSGLVTTVDDPLLPCEAEQPRHGAYSSLRDAVRLMQILANGGVDADGARVLAESTIDSISIGHVPHARNTGLLNGPSIQLFEGEGPAPLSWQVGRKTGHSGSLAVSPQAGFGTIELSDLDWWRMQAPVAITAANAQWDNFPPEDYGAPGSPPWSPSAEEMSEYEGVYVSPVSCEEIEVVALESGLLAQGQAAQPSDRDRFHTNGNVAGARVAFWRDGEDEIYAATIPRFEHAYYVPGRVPDELVAISECTNLDAP